MLPPPQTPRSSPLRISHPDTRFPHPPNSPIIITASSSLVPLPPSPPSSLHLPVCPSNILLAVREFIRSVQFQYGSADLIITPVDSQGFQALLKELDQPVILSGKEADSLRYNYRPDIATITIPAMPTPPHDAVTGYAPDCLDAMREIQFLSRKERSCLKIDTGSDVALPTLPRLSQAQGTGKGGDTSMKQPDAAFYLTHNVSPAYLRRFPRVVFEVAFSQSYESVREDAKHWLVRAQGSIKLVVVVKLFEGVHGNAEADNEEVSKKELEQRTAFDLPLASTSAGGPSREAIADPIPSTKVTHDSPPSATDSTAAPSIPSPTARDHEQWYVDDPAPWVGPITGFLELYRYDAEKRAIYQDGPRYDIFPILPEGTVEKPDQLPQIRILDLLPSTHIDGDVTRTFPLPLDLYRAHIDDGVRRLAANRRARQYQAVRKRQRAEDREDFVPELVERDDPPTADDGPRRSKRNRVQC